MTDHTTGPYPDIRWFEDFAVGQQYTFGAWALTVDSIIEFANIYDPEPFHLDEASARKLGWDGLIASGLQIAAIWRRLSKDAFPNSETVLSPGWDDIRWMLPTYAGDILTSYSEVREARVLSSRPREGLVKIHNTLKRQDGEAVAKITANWFVRRCPK